MDFEDCIILNIWPCLNNGGNQQGIPRDELAQGEGITRGSTRASTRKITKPQWMKDYELA